MSSHSLPIGSGALAGCGLILLRQQVSTSLVIEVLVSKSDAAVTLIVGPAAPVGKVVGRPAVPVKICIFPVSLRNISLEFAVQGKSGGRVLGLRVPPSTSEIIATMPSPAALLFTQTKSLMMLFMHPPVGLTPFSHSAHRIGVGMLNVNGKNSSPNFSNYVSLSVTDATGVEEARDVSQKFKRQ